MQLELSEWNSAAPVTTTVLQKKKFCEQGLSFVHSSKGVYDHVCLSIYKYQIKIIPELYLASILKNRVFYRGFIKINSNMLSGNN